MKKLMIFVLLLGIILIPGSSMQAAENQLVPAISIINVVEDLEVTVQGYNFPKEKTFNVYMGDIGTRGIGGMLVGELETGEGGSITASFDIPEAYWEHDQISIRLEAYPSGYYAYDWFWNSDGNAELYENVNTGESVVYPSSYPYTNVVDVEAGETVTLLAYSFPANDSLTVTIGYFGTRGVGGIEVEPVEDTGATGEFSATFTIPEALKDEPKLSIRLVSDSIGWYAYDYFNNVEGMDPYDYNPYSPTIVVPEVDWPEDPNLDDDVVYPDDAPWAKVLSVVPGESVEVRVANFPTKDSVIITMGLYGTEGVGGVVMNPGYGTTSWGGFTTTFNIPNGLADEEKLCIRFESPDTGYYAYANFMNVPTTIVPGDSGSDNDGIVMPTEPPYIEVITVTPGESVVVKVRNFPYPDTVKVTIGPSWTMGIDGKILNYGYGTGAYGEFTATFNIPPGMANIEKLAIRMVSNQTGLLAYDVFLNK